MPSCPRCGETIGEAYAHTIRFELGDHPVVRAVMLAALDVVSAVRDDQGASPRTRELSEQLDAAFRGQGCPGRLDQRVVG